MNLDESLGPHVPLMFYLNKNNGIYLEDGGMTERWNI